MTVRKFDLDVTKDDDRRFAELSGDWSPLHTDPATGESARTALFDPRAWRWGCGV
jgi:acyl dehydratase